MTVSRQEKNKEIERIQSGCIAAWSESSPRDCLCGGESEAQGVAQRPSVTLKHWCTMIYTVRRIPPET
jgi:hypothetical protein